MPDCQLGGLTLHETQVGAHGRIVEADQDVAFRDRIPVAHPDLLHDAAFEMLHLLARRLDLHGAGCHDRPVERGGHRPCAHCAEDKRDDGEADFDPLLQAVVVAGREGIC